LYGTISGELLIDTCTFESNELKDPAGTGLVFDIGGS
jgi:hypothetical protein